MDSFEDLLLEQLLVTIPENETATNLQTQYEEVLLGTNLADTLVGGTGNDYFQGEAENDLLEGAAGNDVIFGQAGNDFLDGGVGNDYLSGNSFGSLYNEYYATLKPNLDSDDFVKSVINGTPNSAPDSDNPLLTEIDTLTGGAGADTFVLGDVSGIHYYDYFNYDGFDYSYAIINDFDNTAGDKIQLYGNIANYAVTTGDWTGDGTIDSLIHYQGDTIALVLNTSNIDLVRDSYIVEPEPVPFSVDNFGVVDFDLTTDFTDFIGSATPAENSFVENEALFVDAFDSGIAIDPI